MDKCGHPDTESKTYCLKHYRQTFPNKGCDICELKADLAAANTEMAQKVMEFEYKYKISNIRVYDGDTITADIDLGAHIIMHDQKIRLYGINTPEIRTKDLDEKEKGYEAKHYLERLLGIHDLFIREIWIESHKDKKGKFGRWLGTIYVDGENVNRVMVDEGHAVIANY